MENSELIRTLASNGGMIDMVADLAEAKLGKLITEIRELKKCTSKETMRKIQKKVGSEFSGIWGAQEMIDHSFHVALKKAGKTISKSSKGFKEEFFGTREYVKRQFKIENISFYGKKVYEYALINDTSDISRPYDEFFEDDIKGLRKLGAIRNIKSMKLTPSFYYSALTNANIEKEDIHFIDFMIPDIVQLEVFLTQKNQFLLFIKPTFKFEVMYDANFSFTLCKFSDYAVLKELSTDLHYVEGTSTGFQFMLPKRFMKEAIKNKSNTPTLGVNFLDI
jgi:hypothetical protein